MARNLAFGLILAAATASSASPAAAAAVPVRLSSPGLVRTPPAASAPTGRLDAALVAFLNRVNARFVGPAKIPHMTVEISTPMRNAAALKTYAQAASMPNSVYYRHFLTPHQIANAFGTPAETYARTAQYFAKQGLAVKVWPARTAITVTGSGKRIESALGVRFGAFQSRAGGKLQTFYAPMSSIGLAPSFGTVDLAHLVSFRTKHTFALAGGPPIPISNAFGDTSVIGAPPSEIAKAYDYSGAYEAGYTGKGVNIGIIGTGPIDSADGPAFRKLFKIPGSSTISLVPVSVVSGDSTPPPTTGMCTSASSTSPSSTCNPEDGEAQIDSEQTMGLAYDSNVLFYLAYNGAECEVEENPLGSGCIGPDSTSQGLDLSDDELMQAESDNQADILSLSYGECETLGAATSFDPALPGSDPTGTDPMLFEELAAQGIATFVSTGDSGSAGCQPFLETAQTSYPGTDPNVVAVGGTTTPMLPSGLLSGPITTWGQASQLGAETAGMSGSFVTPPYQAAESNVASICTMRCVPDVVADGNPYTGVAVIEDAGANQGGELDELYGGTSVAAPDMAAMWALVLSACEVTTSCTSNYGNGVVDPGDGSGTPAAAPHKFRLGNPNFLWYKLAATANAAQYHQTFYDVVYGNDGIAPYEAQLLQSEGGPNAYTAGIDPGAVNAGPGFDEATGIGAPFARALIKYVVGV